MRARTTFAGALLVLWALFGVGCQQPQAEKKEEEKAKPAENSKPEAEAKADHSKEEKGEDTTPEHDPNQAQVTPKHNDAAQVDPSKDPAPAATTYESVAMLLPAKTSAAFFVANPLELSNALGRQELTEAFKPFLAQVQGEVEAVAGFNPFEPTEFPKIGIDPQGIAGLAFFDLAEERGLAFVSLTDPALFEDYLKKMGETHNFKLLQGQQGPATTYQLENADELLLAIIDQRLFFVASDQEETLPQTTNELLQVTPESSLAKQQDFSNGVQTLAHKDDALLYLDIPTLITQARDDSLFAEKQLAAAQASGDKTEIDFWTQELQREKERLAREDKLIDTFFKPLGGLIIGAQLDGPSAMIDLLQHSQDDAMLRRILVPGPSPAILKGLMGEPLFLAAGHIDTASPLEFLRIVAEHEGDDFDAEMAKFKAASGIDLEADVLKQLTGELGFAVTGQIDLSADSLMGLDAHLVVGIKDRAALLALIKIVLQREPLSALATANGEDWSIQVPDWKIINLHIGDQYIIASTDPGFAHRLSEASGDFLSSLPTPQQDKLAKGELAGIFSLQAATLGAYLLIDQSDMPAQPLPTQGDPKLIAELEKISKEIREAEKEDEKKRNTFISEALAPIGRTLITYEPHPKGFLIQAIQTTQAESLAVLISSTVEKSFKMNQDSRSSQELNELYNKRWEIESQLYRPLEQVGADSEIEANPATQQAPQAPQQAPAVPQQAPHGETAP